MKLYLSVRGEWAGAFDLWIPQEKLLWVPFEELPVAIDEGRELGMVYPFGDRVGRDTARVAGIELYQEQLWVAIEPTGGLLSENGGRS